MNKSALLLLLVVGLLVITDTTVAILGGGRRRGWGWNEKPASAEDANAMDRWSYYEVLQRLNEAEQ
uniref:Uncharacterized protein n=2 Tax=Ciona intestinalis TaxID=7719 RepID=F6TY25_CIOIN